MLANEEDIDVQQNNFIYKGYRLTAKVSRVAPESMNAGADPAFTATIFVVPVNAIQDKGDEFPVPVFAAGGSAHRPRDAISAAVDHGRDIVVALDSDGDVM